MSDNAESSQPQVSEEAVSEEGAVESQEGIQAAPEGAEIQEAIEEAIENGASEKQIKNMIKKFQLKVDGKTIEREVNLGDDEYLRNQLQLAEAARSRMNETAQMRKLLSEVEGKLRSNPWEILEQLGMNPDELAEIRLQSRIEQMKKSPEQIEREKLDQELMQAREEARLLKEEKEKIEFEKLQEKAAVDIENEITQALDAHKTLPKSRHVVKRIADSMLWAMNNGFDNITADDVIPLVEKDLREELNRFMEDMPDDLLEAYIGNKTTDRLRKKRLNTMKTNTVSQIKPTAKSVTVEQNKPKEKVRQKDFFRNLGK